MIANQVDVDLSDQDVAAVMAAIETIRTTLAFAKGLSQDERQQLVKIGRKSQTFTVKALDMAQQHPELMPNGLSVEGAKRDMNLFLSLNPILQALSELRSIVEDTQTIAGSEAYAAARVAYKSAKSLGDGMGLDDVIDDLSQRFQRSRPRQPQSVQATGQ